MNRQFGLSCAAVLAFVDISTSGLRCHASTLYSSDRASSKRRYSSVSRGSDGMNPKRLSRQGSRSGSSSDSPDLSHYITLNDESVWKANMGRILLQCAKLYYGIKKVYQRQNDLADELINFQSVVNSEIPPSKEAAQTWIETLVDHDINVNPYHMFMNELKTLCCLAFYYPVERDQLDDQYIKAMREMRRTLDTYCNLGILLSSACNIDYNTDDDLSKKYSPRIAAFALIMLSSYSDIRAKLLEGKDDNFTAKVYDELQDLIARRGALLLSLQEFLRLRNGNPEGLRNVWEAAYELWEHSDKDHSDKLKQAIVKTDYYAKQSVNYSKL